MYKSVSAFAPISNPVNCDWGKKAFSGYFGEDQQSKWKEHDATELVKQWKGPLDVLIDVVGFSVAYTDSGISIDPCNRELETTFTSKASFYPKTSSRLLRKQEKATRSS